MSKYTTLIEQQSRGYRHFLYVSDLRESTCDECWSRNGEVFTDMELIDQLPPLHPNCRCKVVAMDNEALWQYNMSGESFIGRIYDAMDNQALNMSGLYVLNHSFNLYGISEDTLTALRLPEQTVITVPAENSQSKPWYQGFDDWAVDFGNDAVALWTGMWDAYTERSERIFDNIPSFLDAMTFGLVSGYFRGNEARAETMTSDPSIYSIANWLLSGTPDMLGEAFAPEKPLSLEHWLNSLGTAILLYGAYRMVQFNTAVNAEIDAMRSAIDWPPNDGFNGVPKRTTLQPGTQFDRYGLEGGRYASPVGTPYANRALAPGTDLKPYHVYEVLKPLEVSTGEIAPWFQQPGLGIQYMFDRSIKKLIIEGFIRRVVK